MFEKFNPFGEIGKKIKLMAKIISVASPLITLAAVFSASGSGCSVWPRVLLGALAFCSAWPLYGFGQLVQDIHDMRLGDRRLNNRDDELPRL